MKYSVKNRPKRLLILTQSSFERPLSKVIGPTELKVMAGPFKDALFNAHVVLRVCAYWYMYCCCILTSIWNSVPVSAVWQFIAWPVPLSRYWHSVAQYIHGIAWTFAKRLQQQDHNYKDATNQLWHSTRAHNGYIGSVVPFALEACGRRAYVTTITYSRLVYISPHWVHLLVNEVLSPRTV